MHFSISSSRYPAIVGWLAFALGFSLPISPALNSILSVAILFLWLLHGDWKNKFECLRRNPGVIAMVFLILLAAAGLTWSWGDRVESLRHFAKYANLVLALCLISTPLQLTMRRRALFGFVLGVVLTFLLSYGIRYSLWPATWFPDRTIDNPTVFKLHVTHGFFMALGAFLMLVGAIQAEDRLWRWGLALGAVLAAGNVLIVQGRTGYVVLALLVVYLFIRQFRWRGVAFSLLLVMFAAVFFTQFPENMLVSRITQAVHETKAWQGGSLEDTSMGARLTFASHALQIIAEHPLIGVGTGGFVEAYRQLVPDNPYLVHNPHNQYLLTTAQFGLPGLLALLGMFAGLWYASRRLPAAEQILAQGILLSYAVCNLFNSFLFDHAELMFFAWSVGLLFGSGRESRDQSLLQGA